MTRQTKASNEEEEDEDILGLGDVPYMGDDLLDLGGMDQLALVRHSTYFPHRLWWKSWILGTYGERHRFYILMAEDIEILPTYGEDTVISEAFMRQIAFSFSPLPIRYATLLPSL
jgi:hypothetical protein